MYRVAGSGQAFVAEEATGKGNAVAAGENVKGKATGKGREVAVNNGDMAGMSPEEALNVLGIPDTIKGWLEIQDKVWDLEDHEALPEGWIRIWSARSRQEYYWRMVNRHSTFDLDEVMKDGAITAAPSSSQRTTGLVSCLRTATAPLRAKSVPASYHAKASSAAAASSGAKNSLEVETVDLTDE